MQNRSAKFASALVVCLVATTALAIASDGNAASEAECLAGPKGTPPEGSHWFYGTDHGNNRKCWFLGDAQQKRAITKRVAVAEKPVHRKPKPAMPRQIADARAELPPRVANEPWSVSPARVATATPPSTDNSANADALGEAPRWTLAGRWPDRTDADATIGSEPMAAEKAEAPSNAISKAAPDPGPVSITAPALLAGKLSSAANSVRMLMIVLAASLALAGIIAAAVLKLANIRRTRRGRPVDWEVPFNADRPPLRIEAETPALELGAESWPLQPTFIEPAPAPQMLPRWLQHGRR